MIGIPVALLTANATEWIVHKYVLHGLGKSRESFWSFHWHEHHRDSRRNDMVDPHYRGSLFRWNGQAKEAAALVLTGFAYLPLLPVAPFFTATMFYCGVNYYRKHKRSHLDPQWAREHLPWHYDHHMGPEQHKNWCVTRPWFDHIMGTRSPYAGTPREAADLAKVEAKRARATKARAHSAP